MMNKEDYTPEELRETAEAIRSATLPKSITPEMVGGTMLGILSLLGNKVSGSGALESVLPRLTARSGFIKFSLDLTKADGTVDKDSAFVNLPAATDSLAGLMTNAQNKVVNSLPPVIITDPYFEKTGDVITLKSTARKKGTDGAYATATLSHGSLPAASESQGGVMTRAQVKKLALLDKVLLELTGIGDERSLEIYAGWDPEVTDITDLCLQDTATVYFPKVDMSNVTVAHAAFAESAIEHMPLLDFSNLKTADWMFRLSKIKVLPPFDFHNVTSAMNTFNESQLEEVPDLDFSNCITTGWGLFMDCKKLRKVGQIDFSSCKRLENMFWGCSVLERITPFIPPKVPWDGHQMFYYCPNLIESPAIDWSLCTNIQSLHDGNSRLPSVGVFNTENCTNVHCSFRDCPNLERIESLEVVKATAMSEAFCRSSELKYIKILNLGTQSKVATSGTFYGTTAWGSGCEENRQSLVDSLLTYSFDRAAAGFAALALQLEPEVLARLTDEEIAAITAKGFTLTSY